MALDSGAEAIVVPTKADEVEDLNGAREIADAVAGGSVIVTSVVDGQGLEQLLGQIDWPDLCLVGEWYGQVVTRQCARRDAVLEVGEVRRAMPRVATPPLSNRSCCPTTRAWCSTRLAFGPRDCGPSTRLIWSSATLSNSLNTVVSVTVRTGANQGVLSRAKSTQVRCQRCGCGCSSSWPMNSVRFGFERRSDSGAAVAAGRGVPNDAGEPDQSPDAVSAAARMRRSILSLAFRGSSAVIRIASGSLWRASVRSPWLRSASSEGGSAGSVGTTTATPISPMTQSGRDDRNLAHIRVGGYGLDLRGGRQPLG